MEGWTVVGRDTKRSSVLMCGPLSSIVMYAGIEEGAYSTSRMSEDEFELKQPRMSEAE